MMKEKKIYRGCAENSGIAIPLVVGALIVFGIFASTLLFSSKSEYRLLQKTLYRERARYIALAGLAKSTALIFQNDFEERWYRKSGTRSKYGFTGKFEGELGGGKYEVFAEDVANALTHEMQGPSDQAKEERILHLRYARIDLFSRGTYGDQSIVVFQSVVLKPEQRVYSFDATPGNIAGVPGTHYDNIRLR